MSHQSYLESPYEQQASADAAFEEYLDKHYDDINTAILAQVFEGWPMGKGKDAAIKHGISLLLSGMDPAVRAEWAHNLDPSIPDFETWQESQMERPV